jgi:hypothetical protein
MGFPPDVLDRLRMTDEVRIETRAAPDAPSHRVIIWVVVDDRDRVLVRSVRGTRGRWYREALAHPACVVWIGPEAVPVAAVPAADADRVKAATRGLQAKYASSASLPYMLRENVLDTTVELVPR